jgi:hypothetical protein
MPTKKFIHTCPTNHDAICDSLAARPIEARCPGNSSLTNWSCTMLRLRPLTITGSWRFAWTRCLMQRMARLTRF